VSLTVFAFHDHPHDFAVTKVGAPLEECSFLLDFSRPLKRVRQLFGFSCPVGIAMGLLVPVVHIGEQTGGYLIGVSRGEPYFVDLPQFWKKHRGKSRSIASAPAGGISIVADFATHFPQDC
jgi:hypothetical protein